MGRVIKRALVLAVVWVLAGCAAGKHTAAPTAAPGPESMPAAASEPAPADSAPQSTEFEREADTMQIQIGEKTFTLTLADSEAAAALAQQLPLEMDMSELNGNEKYKYLPFSLPTASYQPGLIRAGDVMLFGDSCLVIFYESFTSGYSYTAIGHIEEADEIKAAVGTGSVHVIIE